MSDPRTRLVGEGYDARVDTWEEWAQHVTDDPRHEWAADLASRLSDGARVLELESWTGEWLGVPTFLSSFPPDVNTELVVDAGLTIDRDEVVTITEPEGPVSFQWILARA